MSAQYGFRKPLLVIATALALVMLAAGGALILLERALFPGAVTNPAEYHEILTSFRAANPRYVAHFPNAIPPAAKGVRMYFQSGVLQGSTMFELRIQLPQNEFDAALAHAETLFAQRRIGPDEPVYRHTRLFTEKSDSVPPATRRTLQLGTGRPGMDVWGISVDPASNEIAYWVIDD
jgi:hypothetical protein